MKRKDIQKTVREFYGQNLSKKEAVELCIQGINATLEELLDDLKEVPTNFKGGTALGMLETVQGKIRALKVKS